jgi:hypothetical protein
MPDDQRIQIAIGDAGVIAIANAAEAGFVMVTKIVEKTPDTQFNASAEIYVEAAKGIKALIASINKLLGLDKEQ